MRSKIKSDFTDREEQKKTAADGDQLEDEDFETPKRNDAKSKSSKSPIFNCHDMLEIYPFYVFYRYKD